MSKKDGQPELARELVSLMREQGLNVSYDEQQSIGKRYAKHDEIGTPFCFTIDSDSLEDKQVTIRYRDSAKQERVSFQDAVKIVKRAIESSNS